MFEERGFKGVMITCAECGEDHYYGWDMLKESLEYMLETGEPRMHEPAFEPHPDEYISWDYGRGYLDALGEAEAEEMEAPPSDASPTAVWLGDRTRCGYCRGRLPARGLHEWMYCPFCGANLAPLRLAEALDRYEGVAIGAYSRAHIDVETDEGLVNALIYLATDTRNKQPSTRYVDALIRGAKAFGLPNDYIEQLRAARDSTTFE